jgi:multidrug resistance efflux pump
MPSLWATQDPHVIQKGKAHFKTALRVKVKSSSSTPIKNLMRWPRVIDIIDDGTRVEKGDLLVRFDRDLVHQELQKMEMSIEIDRLDLERKIKEIDQKTFALEEDLREKINRYNVLMAKYERAKAVPFKRDIELAQGVYDVAKLNLEAAKNEYDKALRRREKGLISESALLKVKDEWLMEKARYEYSEKMLKLEKLPSTKNQLKVLELQLENAQLDIDLNKEQLEEEQEIAKIQKKTEESSLILKETNLEEKRKELEGIELFAPREGIVEYTSSFKRTLNEGRKPRKKSIILEMPNLNDVVLEGFVPEREGYQISIGDSAKVYHPHDEKWLKAKVVFISRNPRDINDASDDWSMQGKSSGIKIFNIQLKLLDLELDLNLGMVLEAEIEKTSSVSALWVPLEYVKTMGGQTYLSSDHSSSGRRVWSAVDGSQMGGQFLLADESWLGRKVYKDGESALGEYALPELKSVELDSPSSVSTEVQHGEHLVLLGELKPEKSLDINVPRFHRWHRGLKVTWIEEEGKHVQSGNVILKLSSENIDKEFRDTKSRLSKAKGEL